MRTEGFVKSDELCCGHQFVTENLTFVESAIALGTSDLEFHNHKSEKSEKIYEVVREKGLKIIQWTMTA